MRRRAGVGKLLQKKREREKAAAKGQEIEEQHLEHVEKVLGEFKEHLEQFASRHRDDINKVTIVASRPAHAAEYVADLVLLLVTVVLCVRALHECAGSGVPAAIPDHDPEGWRGPVGIEQGFLGRNPGRWRLLL